MRVNSRPSSMRTSAGRATAQLLLLSLLAASPIAAQLQPGLDQDLIVSKGPVVPTTPELPQPETEHTFTLRQIFHHGTDEFPRLHRKKDVWPANGRVMMAAGGDDDDDYPAQELPPLRARGKPQKIERLVDRRPSVVDPLVTESRRRGAVSLLSPSAWSLDDVSAPDVTDKETVLNMALMAADCYVEKEGEGDWEEVGGYYNRSVDFGWEADGLRGHIWADESNSTIVLGIKGTSPAVFDGSGTTTNDKINDNLFFSCCCAQQGQWTWHQVCDCATSTYSCNNTCVTQNLYDEHRYYTAVKELYSNVTELYPESQVWLTGHSLGGAVASLLGLTYGLPTVTFEAVPEALPANRLGLPMPPSVDPRFPQARQSTGTFHFGHTADPIYIGTCNGATASCSFGGYALESVCHSGLECVYDVVADKGWRVGIGTHKIHSVIHDVIMKYDTVPECKPNPDCRDCSNWKFYESNGTDSTTTTTTTTTSLSRTRTATCQTPGWWGCLDETTTTPVTTTTTSTTTTCQTPGWFGCKDKTTTTTTSEVTTTTPVSTTTTTCETPGRFWGCYDDTTMTTTTTSTSTSSTSTPPITSPPSTASIPAPTEEPPHTSRCVRRSWFGFCKEWRGREQWELPEEI